MENQDKKYKYFTRDNILPYGLYFVRDNRDDSVVMGYTSYGEVLWDYYTQEKPEWDDSNLHQYIWQEGVEHFTYFYFPVCGNEPDYFSSVYIKNVKRSVAYDWQMFYNVISNANLGYKVVKLVSIIRSDDNPLVFEKKEMNYSKPKNPVKISNEAFMEIYLQLSQQPAEPVGLYYPNFINEVSYV
jgi:hypothetical protein